MKKVSVLIIVLLSMFCYTLNAQVMRKDGPAFKAGEVAVYNIYYNWGFVWIHAGDVRFSVEEKNENGTPHYLLKLVGYTIKSFDHFYTVRDTFSVTVSKEELMPFYYREVKHEDSYFCDKRYHFDFAKDYPAMVYWDINRRGNLTSDSLKIDKTVFDLLTTCYRFRSLDMQQVKKGDFFPFNMLYDDTVYNLGLTYKGEEEIKLRNKSRYNALKFAPKLITGDLFKNEDDMAIYVSDDDNHVPLYIEAKIKVGYVKVMLQSVVNTKYPFSPLKKK